nr:diguanylate cyclase [Planosporangium thailandense]
MQTGEGAEPSRAELRLALAEMTGDALVPAAFGLAALYAVYTVGWLLRGDLPTGPRVMASVCFVMAVGFLAAALWLRRRPIRPGLAHPVAVVYGVALMANCLLAMYYDRSLSDTFNVILVLMGFAILVRSLPYMFSFVAAGATGWLIMAYHVSGGVDFQAWLFPVVGAAVVSILVNAGYRRTALRLERARHRLRHAAELDPLTGLYNRRGFWLQAGRILETADRDGAPFAAMFVDIDRMKEINDRFGHAAGDAAITATADLLRQVLCSDDPIARLGGDEFCALLTGEIDQEPVRARIVESLGELNRLRPHPLSLSVGFARYDPASPCSIDELLQRGDIAMYEHKRARSRQRHPSRP